MATKQNDPCRDKSASNEPIFTLCARDLTADLVVEFWIQTQLRLRHAVSVGVDPVLAVAMMKRELVLERDLPKVGGDAKLSEAVHCAAAMRLWPNRKLPD